MVNIDDRIDGRSHLARRRRAVILLCLLVFGVPAAAGGATVGRGAPAGALSGLLGRLPSPRTHVGSSAGSALIASGHQKAQRGSSNSPRNQPQKAIPQLLPGHAVSSPSSKAANPEGSQGVLKSSHVGHRPGVYLGVSLWDAPQHLSILDNFQRLVRKHVAIIEMGRTMAGSASTLPRRWLEEITRNGSVPMITWLPENSDPGAKQLAYSLRNIANGVDDEVVNAWAHELKIWGRPVLIRFAHEMNGTWYPWGRQPRAFVAAWRHIHNIFVKDGATNVQWVWCPNTQWDSSSMFAPYYPGNAYVNWIGLDAYNKPSAGNWLTLRQLLNFDSSYADITSLTSKPLIIAEWSSAEDSAFPGYTGQTKAEWITEAFDSDIPSMPRIKAVVWLNEKLTSSEGCCDWRIQSSRAAVHAFARAIASPRYLSGYQK